MNSGTITTCSAPLSLDGLRTCRGEGAQGFALAKSKPSLCFVRTDPSSGLVEWTCERAGNASSRTQETNLLDQQNYSLSTPHTGLYCLRRRMGTTTSERRRNLGLRRTSWIPDNNDTSRTRHGDCFMLCTYNAPPVSISVHFSMLRIA